MISQNTGCVILDTDTQWLVLLTDSPGACPWAGSEMAAACPS